MITSLINLLLSKITSHPLRAAELAIAAVWVPILQSVTFDLTTVLLALIALVGTIVTGLLGVQVAKLGQIHGLVNSRLTKTLDANASLVGTVQELRKLLGSAANVVPITTAETGGPEK